MRRRWLARTTLTVGLGLIIWVAISLTAQAEADDGISPGEVANDCTHGGPYRDQDVWVFDTTKVSHSKTNATESDETTLAQGDPTAGAEGTELSATFEGPDGQTETRKINSRVYDLEGHSVAWLNAPAGWRLVGTTPEELRVVGTCPASQTQALGPQETKDAPTTNERAANVQSQTLPQTGQDVGAMVTLGTALVGTGIMLLFVRRKRPSPPPPRHRATDRVWTYPTN